MLLHSFLSLLAVTPVPRKPLRILSPLQKLLIRSHRLRLLPLPPLLLPPVLEGQMPPGLCRPQLLAVLVESGVLRPGQITVGTAES